MFRKSLILAVIAFTANSILLAEDPKPIKALLVIGGCCHDYNGQKDLIVDGLKQRTFINVDVAYDTDKSTKHMNPVYEKDNWADGYDVIIHDECSSDVKELKTIERILAPHKNGLPAVMLHCAMHSYRSEGYPEVTPWFELTGAQSTGHGPLKPIEISFNKTANSPILKGLDDWTTINEELYNNSAGKLLDTATALASGKQIIPNRDGSQTTAQAVVVWTNRYKENTRVFSTTLGHANDTLADARYADLVTRGLLWSCDKLNDTYLKAK